MPTSFCNFNPCKRPNVDIKLFPFICKYRSGNLQLKEHRQALWVNLEELPNFDWTEADKPIVEDLLNLFQSEE